MALDIDKVREVAERIAASSGLELVELEMRGGGKARMLRVFIDKPEGVTHEDCANFSREFGTILDVEDVIPGRFVPAGGFVPGARSQAVQSCRLSAFRREPGEVEYVRTD